MPRDHEVDGAGVSPRRADPDRRCVQCGCDEGHACVDAHLHPCAWASPSLCNYCEANIPAFKPGMKIYEGQVQPGDGGLSVIVRQSRMGRDAAGPFVDCDLYTGLTFCAEVVSGVTTRAAGVAASVLADCFPDDTRTISLANGFALEVIEPLLQEQLWVINEFQVRQWVADNMNPGERIRG